MSETQEDTLLEEEVSAENREKLARIGRILLRASVIVIWSVSAGLGLRDIWSGEGILETPWVIFSIVFTFVLAFVVIMPLFQGLRADIQDYKQRKEEEEQ
jgi:hypothetical protein